MTEKILNSILSRCTVKTSLRMGDDGIISAFPSGGAIIARFLDGSELRSTELTLRTKTKTPSDSFFLMEKLSQEIRSLDLDELYSDSNIVSVLLSSPVGFEKCSEKGFYIISCLFNIEFLSEKRGDFYV